MNYSQTSLFGRFVPSETVIVHGIIRIIDVAVGY